MEENKVNFLYPSTSPTSPILPNFTDVGISSSFSLSPRQVPILQIYPTRKIKHQSFRKRASSGSMPYYIPFKNRQRTKSENADGQAAQAATSQHESSMDCENINEKNLVMDLGVEEQQVSSNPEFNKVKNSLLKKSKSMESLVLKASPSEETIATNSSTLEFPTLLHRIQKLKFNE